MLPIGRDDEGQEVTMADTSRINIHSTEYKKNDVIRGMVVLFFYSMFDEETQVNGTIYFEDTSNFTMKHQMYFGIEDTKRSMQLWQVGTQSYISARMRECSYRTNFHCSQFQDNFPARFKGLHFFGMGPVMEGFMALIKPILSKKWKERVSIQLPFTLSVICL